MSVLGNPTNPNPAKKAESVLNPLCKLCLLSVMPGEPRVWLRKPMGVSHESCATNRTDIERV